MVAAISDLPDQMLLGQLVGGGDTPLLRQLFGAAAVFALETHRHTCEQTETCRPLTGQLAELATTMPPTAAAPQAAPQAAGAISHLLAWFAAHSTGEPAYTAAAEQSWAAMTGAQRLYTTALAMANLRAELAALPAHGHTLLTHTLTSAPVPADPFAHIYTALWAAAVAARQPSAEMAIAEQVSKFGPQQIPLDIVWICVRTLASRLTPGDRAVLPPSALVCPCREGIAAAAALSDWVTAVAAGTPHARPLIETFYTRTVADGEYGTANHLTCLSVHWLAQDPAHRPVTTPHD